MMAMTAARMMCAGMVLFGLAGGAGAAQNDAGTSAGLLLRLGSGARGPAMGDAISASATGVAALHYNPAGVGFTNRAEAGAMFQNLVLDVNQGELGFTHPINSVSGWGVNARYLDYGRTQRVTLADIVNNNVSSTTFGGQDIAIGATYSRQFTEVFSAGVTGKIIHQEIDNSSATAVAADFGAMFRSAYWPIPVRIGIVAANLGSKLQLDRVGENLPALIRGGVAVDLFNQRLTLEADVEKVRDQAVTAQIGGEFRLLDQLALRVGYDGRIDSDNGLTAGFGVKVSDLTVDYAYVPYGQLGNNHRIGLMYQWGPKY